MNIEKKYFGKTEQGIVVQLFTLINENGMSVKITNYGATLVGIFVPDINGKYEDVVLGYDKLDGYFTNTPYFGGTIGRNSNRIENAEFNLNGKKYRLDQNDGVNNNHGGFSGYNKRVWDSEIIQSELAIRFTLFSPNGDQGFPGDLNVSVKFTLTNDNSIKIEYEAKGDQDTIVNLTNHSYFNLSGHPEKYGIENHKVWINATYYTPVINQAMIPSGIVESVKGTPMDFRISKKVGTDIEDGFVQLKYGKGYDHNWVLDKEKNRIEKVAELLDEITKRKMDVYTNMPGIQVYSGNYLDGKIIGKNNIAYEKRSGICFETQYFPDAIHHDNFPSSILKAAETYRSTTLYKFSIQK